MLIDDATRSAIEEDCSRYPDKRGGLLPALHRVQAQSGFISPDLAAELAEFFEIRPLEVMEVVSFYNMFYATPQGRHHVAVCTNLPCSLRGARGLLARIESHLGVRAGETTEDGRITLGREECLGACAYAPMMRVDESYHEDLDFEQARQVLDALE